MSDSVKAHAMVVHITERAVLFRIRDVNNIKQEPQPDEWIPKSQIIDCNVEVDDLLVDEVVDLEIPEWLAIERELDYE